MKSYPVLILGIMVIVIGSLFAILTQSFLSPQVQRACTMEAKLCPDGSSVGRTGPNCEFAECPMTPIAPFPEPVPGSLSSTLKAALNQKVFALNVTLTPHEVISDSRCPRDVQCIWAGTVKVRTKVESGLGTSEMDFELGVPMTTEVEEITLTEVSPGKVSTEAIPDSSYRFTFEVKKR
jgi:hypothetical protein